MTRLLLLRHGQSEWNAVGRWQGHGDPPLSDHGRRQAADAAERLTGFQGAIVSSPLLRAAETADILGRELGLPVTGRDDGLKEIDVGEWTGLTTPQIDERWPGLREAVWRGEDITHPGGERRSEFLARVLDAVGRVASQAATDTIVVTHGGLIHAIERHTDSHPGASLPNLAGRWFDVGDTLTPAPDRVALVDHDPS